MQADIMTTLFDREISLPQLASPSSAHPSYTFAPESNQATGSLCNTPSNNTPLNAARTRATGLGQCRLENPHENRDELVDGKRCHAFFIPFAITRDLAPRWSSGRRSRRWTGRTVFKEVDALRGGLSDNSKEIDRCTKTNSALPVSSTWIPAPTCNIIRCLYFISPETRPITATNTPRSSSTSDRITSSSRCTQTSPLPCWKFRTGRLS